MMTRVIAAAFLLLACTSLQAQSELVENGGFETGDFTGWVAMDADGDTSNVLVASGAYTTIAPVNLPAPPEGSFAAIMDSGGPGLQYFYQDISIPASAVSANLSLQFAYENSNSDFVIGPGLDFNGAANQQLRIDLMDPAAPVDDVGAGVLQNLFQTNPGDPLVSPYQSLGADLSAYIGQTVRLRVAKVDNQFFFAVALDAVSVDSRLLTPGPPIPMPVNNSLALILLLFGVLVIGGFALRRYA